MTYMEKIKEAQKRKIDIPTELADGRSRVGIYKFFKIKDNDIYCFYVGKSTDIAYRLLGSSGGHIYMYLNNNLKKLVPIKIAEYIKNGYAIRVEITEVNYEDTSFSKAAHRLALAELQEIVKYQEMGQCEFQLPEGVGEQEEKFWEDNYKKLN